MSDIPQHQTPVVWRGNDIRDDDREGMTLRLVVSANRTNGISAEIVCERADLAFQRFGVEHGPSPFMPSAVKERIMGHEAPSGSNGGDGEP